MMRNIYLFAALTMTLAACSIKDPIYETPHPDHGRITLTTDWSGRGEGIDIPDSHHVRANGDEEGRRTFTAHTNDHPDLFEPGSHRLHLFHDAAGISVSGNTASVGAVTRAGGIDPNPDWFFSSVLDIEIEKDNVHEYTAVMEQQVRQLTLVVEPVGGSTERIASVTGTLSGVAGTFDIDTGAHGSASDVALTFTKITTGDDAGKWSATVRLLGTADGAQQHLAGTIAFTDNSPAALPFAGEMTTALAGFNDGKKTPLALGGTVVETRTGAGFTGTITGWTTINGNGVIAD